MTAPRRAFASCAAGLAFVALALGSQQQGRGVECARFLECCSMVAGEPALCSTEGYTEEECAVANQVYAEACAAMGGAAGVAPMQPTPAVAPPAQQAGGYTFWQCQCPGMYGTETSFVCASNLSDAAMDAWLDCNTMASMAGGSCGTCSCVDSGQGGCTPRQ